MEKYLQWRLQMDLDSVSHASKWNWDRDIRRSNRNLSNKTICQPFCFCVNLGLLFAERVVDSEDPTLQRWTLTSGVAPLHCIGSGEPNIKPNNCPVDFRLLNRGILVIECVWLVESGQPSKLGKGTLFQETLALIVRFFFNWTRWRREWDWDVCGGR